MGTPRRDKVYRGQEAYLRKGLLTMPTNINLLGKKPEDSLGELLDAFTDVTGGEMVQVAVDRPRGVLHVNVNGICLLRICRIKQIAVEGN